MFFISLLEIFTNTQCCLLNGIVKEFKLFALNNQKVCFICFMVRTLMCIVSSYVYCNVTPLENNNVIF